MIRNSVTVLDSGASQEGLTLCSKQPTSLSCSQETHDCRVSELVSSGSQALGQGGELGLGLPLVTGFAFCLLTSLISFCSTALESLRRLLSDKQARVVAP